MNDKIIIFIVNLGWLSTEYTVDGQIHYLSEGAAHLLEHLVYKYLVECLDKIEILSSNATISERNTRFEILYEGETTIKDFKNILSCLRISNEHIESERKICELEYKRDLLNKDKVKLLKSIGEIFSNSKGIRFPTGKNLDYIDESYLTKLFRDFYLNGTYALYQIEGNKIEDMEFFENPSIKIEQTILFGKEPKVLYTSYNGILIDWKNNNVYLSRYLDDIVSKEIQVLLSDSIIKNDIYHLQLEKGSLWLFSNLNNAALDQMLRELKERYEENYNYKLSVDSLLSQPIIYWIRKLGLSGSLLELLKEFYRMEKGYGTCIKCIEIEAIAKYE